MDPLSLPHRLLVLPLLPAVLFASAPLHGGCAADVGPGSHGSPTTEDEKFATVATGTSLGIAVAALLAVGLIAWVWVDETHGFRLVSRTTNGVVEGIVNGANWFLDRIVGRVGSQQEGLSTLEAQEVTVGEVEEVERLTGEELGGAATRECDATQLCTGGNIESKYHSGRACGSGGLPYPDGTCNGLTKCRQIKDMMKRAAICVEGRTLANQLCFGGTIDPGHYDAIRWSRQLYEDCLEAALSHANCSVDAQPGGEHHIDEMRRRERQDFFCR